MCTLISSKRETSIIDRSFEILSWYLKSSLQISQLVCYVHNSLDSSVFKWFLRLSHLRVLTFLLTQNLEHRHISSPISAIKDQDKWHCLAVVRARCKYHLWYNLLYLPCHITYPLAQKSSQCFLIPNQTEYKIIVLSLKTLNNSISSLFPIISLHRSYTPAKLNCHHSPKYVSHTSTPMPFLGTLPLPRGPPIPSTYRESSQLPRPFQTHLFHGACTRLCLSFHLSDATHLDFDPLSQCVPYLSHVMISRLCHSPTDLWAP